MSNMVQQPIFNLNVDINDLPPVKDHMRPPETQPVNRLSVHGPEALSITELLALCLSGDYTMHQAEHIISAVGGIHNLSQLTTREIESIEGISNGDAARMLAALELGRRTRLPKEGEPIQISRMTQAADIFAAAIGFKKKEHLITMQLDTQRYMIGLTPIYQGSINTITIRLAEVLKPALVQDADSIIICHNHPGGDPYPSTADIKTTYAFTEICLAMGIDLVDHIIVAGNAFVSMQQTSGLMAKKKDIMADWKRNNK